MAQSALIVPPTLPKVSVCLGPGAVYLGPENFVKASIFKPTSPTLAHTHTHDLVAWITY